MMNKVVNEKIEFLKEKLNKLIEQYGTQNPEVLKCSQKLDRLIYYSYKKGSCDRLKIEKIL
jgi:hypothetical protein